MNHQWLNEAGAWLRRHKVLLGILLLPWVVIVVAVGLLVAEHVRGSIYLGRYIRALIAQGEKMNPQDFKPPPPTGENGAPEILAAAKDLKAGAVLPNSYSPRMRLTPAGHAVVCFREEQWVEDKVTNHWEQLTGDLAPNLTTLERIRVAMAKPVLNCEFDPTLGPLAPFPHLSIPKTVSRWLGARIELSLHEGRTRETLADLVTEIDLPRVLARDGIVISELVRVAVAAIARGDTWEALQADGWTDDDLAQIQQVWEKQEFATAMTRALEGERAFAQSSYLLMRKSNDQTAAVFYAMEQYMAAEERPQWEQWVRDLPGGEGATDFLKKQVYCRVWRFAWLDQDQLHYLRYLERLIALGRDGSREKSFQKLQSAADDLALKFQNRGIYNRLRYRSEMSVNSLSRIFARSMRAETERSLVLTAIALKRYGLRHGAAPESLSALVPGFLPSVPVDYMDGQPLRFRRQPDGGFVLYSVGEDGKDDGGDAGLRQGKTNLRMIWDRKDVVWPAPATAEEVRAHRAESAKN